MSRTRDHLVVPLPRAVPGSELPRDRWRKSICDGLGFDGTPGAGTYSLDVEAPDDRTRAIDVAVNAVDTLTTHSAHDDSATSPAFAATSPPAEEDLPALAPRILRSRTLYPLSETPEANILDHLPDIAASKLWEQLERAERIIVEKPLCRHSRRGDVEFEIEAQADFVLQNPDGSWTITDTKIALTDMTSETRRRYEIHVSCYTTLLAAESSVDEPINCAIETFGAVTDRQEVQLSSSELQEYLDALLEGGQRYAG